jgi:hypothetical protein
MHIDDARQRIHYLSTVAADRLKRLAEITEKYAVPWYKRFGVTAQELAPTSERWYQEY